jgi:hypothetical protein
VPKLPIKKSTMVTAGIAFVVVIITIWALNNNATAKAAGKKVGVTV